MTSKLKHVLILRFPYRSSSGGGERYTLTVCDGTSQELIWHYRGTDSILFSEFKKRGWDTRRVWLGIEPVAKWSIVLFPLISIFTLPRGLFLLLRAKTQKISTLLMMSLGEKILLTPFARLLGFQIIWTEHVEPRRWLTLNPFRPFYVFFSRFVTVVVTSQYVKSTYVKLGIAEKNLRVIPFGLPPREPKKTVIPKHLLETPKLPFTIGTVARLEKEKGIEFLISAIKIVKNILPNVRLLVIGSGSQLSALQFLTHHLGLVEQVQFIPYQKNIEPWYRLFDVFVLPSAGREAFGMVLLEAMRAGRPVIGSNLGGIPEIIQHGVNGYLVQPGSSEEIADRILEIYHHPEKTLSMIRAAKELVATTYSEQQLLNTWKNLLSPSQS